MIKKKIAGFTLIFSLLFTYMGLQQNVFADGTSLQIGAWPGSQPNASNITALQNQQQKKLDIVETYINWSSNFDSIKLNADPTYANGSVLLVTWEPWEYDTVKIKNGEADNYITKMANDIKAYGKEIWLRPLHEANGNWYPWCIGDSKVNTNETYIVAYRHIVDIFRAQKVTNVKWIFNINCSNVGQGASFTGNYPGNDYVDYTSIDGYNWGTTQSWGSKWQTFDEIFSVSYNALKQYNKPIIIAEVASTEVGGDKAKWIADSFNTIKSSYDKIFAVVWFNEKKETDWPIDSTPASLDAYRKAIAASTTPAGSVGDLNGDGSVDTTDYALMKRYLIGSINDFPVKNSLTAGDLNLDGIIDSLDYSILKRYLMGNIPKLPYTP